MKLTKQALKQIIKEELSNVLSEADRGFSRGETDYLSDFHDRKAADEQEYFRGKAQDARIADNEAFAQADMRGKKKAATIYKRNKDEIYDLVISRIAGYDRVKSTLGKGKVTRDAVHNLINKAIDMAGSVRVGNSNVTYLNALIPRAASEEIQDWIGKLDGQKLEKRAKEMAKGSENQAIAQNIINYINPVLTAYLDENRGFMKKAGSFVRGKGFREE